MLLGFQDPSKLRTKKIRFDAVYDVRGPCNLEQLNELSYRRGVIEESLNERGQISEAISPEMAERRTSQNQKDIQNLEVYLPLLQNFILQNQKSSREPRWMSGLKIRWSSALTASPYLNLGGPKFFRIDSLRFELGMILFLYGAILRERAFETLSADLVETATLFRRAAGAYNYLAEVVLPPLQPSLPKEKPQEATSSMSSIMSLICLADAQAVTIKKGEEKGSSAILLSKLHCGVTQMLKEAASIMKNRSGGDWDDVSSRLKEFIMTCGALHEMRSQKYLAEDLRGKEEAGTAVAVLRNAMATMSKVRAPRSETWRSIVAREMKDAGEMLRRFEHENEFVWEQKIPGASELPIPQGQRIVNAVPYEPQGWERLRSMSIM